MHALKEKRKVFDDFTSDLPFSHPSPESLSLSHRPILDLCAEAPEELVLLDVRYPPAGAALIVNRRGRMQIFT